MYNKVYSNKHLLHDECHSELLQAQDMHGLVACYRYFYLIVNTLYHKIAATILSES